MVQVPQRLAGKVALITGAAKGIGAVIARVIDLSSIADFITGQVLTVDGGTFV